MRTRPTAFASGMDWRIRLGQVLAVGLGLLAALATTSVTADPPRVIVATPPVWSTSPFHRLQDGDAKIIPCRCSVQGRLVPLGTTVCMQTHLGTQLARCDLSINNTTWIPTGQPCEISSRSEPRYRRPV